MAFSQLALGLAGFSSILVALSGDPKEWKPLDSFRIKNMLLSSFLVTFLALIPVLFRALALQEPAVWRAALVVLAFGTSFGSGLFILRGALGLSPAERRILNPTLIAVVLSGLALASIGETVAAFFAGPAAPGVFFAGLLVLFGLSVYLIVRFLFARPGAH